jgi:hypothetical protein
MTLATFTLFLALFMLCAGSLWANIHSKRSVTFHALSVFLIWASVIGMLVILANSFISLF